MRRSITVAAAMAAVICAGFGCATIARSTGIGDSAGLDLVAITSTPAGATVHIDGAQVGVTPLTMKVSPRAKSMTFSKDGHYAVTIPIPKDWRPKAMSFTVDRISLPDNPIQLFSFL